MTETITLEVHLSTDVVYQELEVSFIPAEEGGLGKIPTQEWSGLGLDQDGIRDELKTYVQDRVENIEEFEPYLGSDRIGERLDVTLGTITITPEGEIVTDSIRNKSPDDFDW